MIRKGSESLKRIFFMTAAILIALSVLLMSGICLAEEVRIPPLQQANETGEALTSIPTPEPEITRKPTATPKPTRTPKPTPKPTRTPKPTPKPTRTPKPKVTRQPTPTPIPTPTATPVPTAYEVPITLTPAPTAEDPEDFVPPSPEPPEPAKQGHPTAGPTEMLLETVIDHINFPKEYRDFRFSRDAKLLEIWFPNIRDADAAILTFDGQVYMIDCGDEGNGNRNVVLVQQLGIEKVDILFNSHPHHDHIKGLAVTADAVKFGEIKVCFPLDSTESGLWLEQFARERNIPISDYQSGDWFTMGQKGEVTLLFLRNYDPMMDMNNQSAQTVVRYKDRSILFTSDMEKNGQAQLLKHVDPKLLKCDILKFPHHAKSAMYEDFFYAVDPKLAVVTSVQGRKDPGQKYLVAKHMPAAYTSIKGQFVHLATDGNYWLCEYVSSNGK